MPERKRLYDFKVKISDGRGMNKTYTVQAANLRNAEHIAIGRFRNEYPRHEVSLVDAFT